MRDLTNSVIVWRPGTENIQVIDLGQEFPMDFASWGACNSEVRDAVTKTRRSALLRKYVILTARDKVPAMAVFRAFCELKEFSDLTHFR